MILVPSIPVYILVTHQNDIDMTKMVTPSITTINEILTTAYGLINDRKFNEMLKFYQLTYLNTEGHLPSAINSSPTSVKLIPTFTLEVSTAESEKISKPDKRKFQVADLASNPIRKRKYLESDERNSHDYSKSVRRIERIRPNKRKNKEVIIIKISSPKFEDSTRLRETSSHKQKEVTLITLMEGQLCTKQESSVRIWKANLKVKRISL